MPIKIGIIGGTGFADAFAEQCEWKPAEVRTPFGNTSAPVLTTVYEGLPLCFVQRHGVGHHIAPGQVNYRANVYALKALGCTHVIASGACGSLREQIEPRHLVLADQFIDRTHRRARTFFEDDVVVHAEFSEPTCAVLRGVLASCQAGVQTKVHTAGTYVCMEGPLFSTRAESNMHRIWGGDLIGMTAMPEAKLCREAQMAYALVALATDYDCWRPHPPGLSQTELLKEIISHLHAATSNAITLIKAAVTKIATMRESDLASVAHNALAMAVWTKPDRITPAVREKYGVLLG